MPSLISQAWTVKLIGIDRGASAMMGRFRQATDTSARSTKQFRKQLRDAREASRDYAQMAGAGAIATFVLTGAFRKSLAALKPYEARLASIRALLGLTTARSNELSEQMLKMSGRVSNMNVLSPNFRTAPEFKPMELVESARQFAQAGLTLGDTMQALRTSADVATSGFISLKEAQELTLNVMKAFQVEGSALRENMDKIIKVAQLTPLSVQDTATAMGFASGTAAAFNQTLDSTLAMLGLLLPVTKTASKAGTSFRAAMQAILRPRGRKIMEQIGVSAVDAAGNMRQLPDVMIDLVEAFEKRVDPAQRQFLKAQLLGIRGTQAFAAVQNATVRGSGRLEGVTLRGAEAARELSRQSKNARGTMDKFTREMRDTYPKAVERFGASVEALKITFGETFAGPAKLVVNALTGITSSMREMLRVGGGFGAITTGIALTTVSIVAMSAALQNTVRAFRAIPSRLDTLISLGGGAHGAAVGGAAGRFRVSPGFQMRQAGPGFVRRTAAAQSISDRKFRRDILNRVENRAARAAAEARNIGLAGIQADPQLRRIYAEEFRKDVVRQRDRGAQSRITGAARSPLAVPTIVSDPRDRAARALATAREAAAKQAETNARRFGKLREVSSSITQSSRTWLQGMNNFGGWLVGGALALQSLTFAAGAIRKAFDDLYTTSEELTIQERARRDKLGTLARFIELQSLGKLTRDQKGRIAVTGRTPEQTREMVLTGKELQAEGLGPILARVTNLRAAGVESEVELLRAAKDFYVERKKEGFPEAGKTVQTILELIRKEKRVEAIKAGVAVGPENLPRMQGDIARQMQLAPFLTESKWRAFFREEIFPVDRWPLLGPLLLPAPTATPVQQAGIDKLFAKIKAETRAVINVPVYVGIKMEQRGRGEVRFTDEPLTVFATKTAKAGQTGLPPGYKLTHQTRAEIPEE